MITQAPTAASSLKPPLQPSHVGQLEAPRITLLGSLDDAQGTGGMALEGQDPKPFLAIIYTGI
ncbi:hypothetical protein M4R22_13280 [Acidovorax sp. GBBC 3334]|uniref:hypothetical protein n=1 Tax=unclassified Acidovorax TaxID=2684926 RepID=UPI002303DF52|nr:MULTISPECIES: hypothetical protein [unclassified Acidovorax]MDA8455739.1 hypothetical protein [Acidovorax sp. GBBC 3334]MDA8523201.1 hypothetical protein [Acidovorax sp. NCPPB 4044]